MTRKKPVTRKKAAAPAADEVPVLDQRTWFEKDDAETPEDRNDALSDLLLARWNPLQIVSIRRIEIGTERGWEATYRP
jgi:hypothetical protein